MIHRYEVVIVGAGTAGMSAGMFLAKKGVKTLLIDAFDPPHNQGSHHGDTRIIRHAYGEGRFYVPLALRAQSLWEELEKESGETLFLQTGILGAGNTDSPFIKETVKSAKEYDLRLEVMNAEDIQKRWSGIQLPEDFIGCFEPNSGILLAEKCVAAFRKLALRYGADLWTYTNVEALKSQEEGIEIKTNKGKVYADRCIVTAGAWTSRLLHTLEIPLTPTRKTVSWFEADETRFNANVFPGFFFQLPTQSYYGFPSIDGCGVKLGRMDGGQSIDPDNMNRTFGDFEEDEGDVRGFLQEYMPAAAGKLKQGKVCIFTRTPDEHFIMDTHPEYKNVLIAGGFSGHGFKFGSVMGEILSKLSLGEAIPFDLSHFKLGRFLNKEKKSRL
ncbi:N-methyl-L-tryptophan oxidase [Bacillus carboniphilus]|uniref:N-methyl-L-tryptophan oxidase n=1 Tax=Bacillus carboniphilus TaxID=86663 RepID=A0ABP3G1D7_9BACI